MDTLDQSTVSEPDPPPLAEPERPKSRPLVAQENGRQHRRRNVTIVAAIVVIFLCLCALALSAYFWWGDPLMNALGVY